jgi:NADPH:quinone reductase-like Zn-dependent oxidoreductase
MTATKARIHPLTRHDQAAVVMTGRGAPTVLQVARDQPLPMPGPGEVRVRIEASSVQFTDTMIRRGKYPDVRDRTPFSPGYDFVGTVDAIGDGVSRWQPGDRVADLCVIGGNARYIVRPAVGLVRVPDDVDAAEATTLILSWVSAQQAVFRAGRLGAGQRLLYIGGAGAVGQAAIQLAVAAGVEVWATASARHHALIRGLGATPLSRDDWPAQVAHLGGFDAVIDGVAADAYRSTHAAVRPGGTFVPIGMSAVLEHPPRLVLAIARAVLWSILPGRRRTDFYSITRTRKQHPEWFAADLSALLEALRAGVIRPVVAERLTLDQVADAHIRLERGGLEGKLVLDPWA